MIEGDLQDFKNSIINELRLENEKILEQRLHTLESEFHQHISSYMSKLIPKPDKCASPLRSTVERVDDADATDDSIVNCSSSHMGKSKSPSKLLYVYEGNQRTAIVTPKREQNHNNMSHVTVSVREGTSLGKSSLHASNADISSRNDSDAEVEEEHAACSSSNSRQHATFCPKKEVVIAEHLIKRYGITTTTTPSSEGKKSTKKNKGSSINSAVKEDLYVTSISLKADDIDSLLDRKADSTTKILLRKSQMLLDDALIYRQSSSQSSSPVKLPNMVSTISTPTTALHGNNSSDTGNNNDNNNNNNISSTSSSSGSSMAESSKLPVITSPTKAKSKKIAKVKQHKHVNDNGDVTADDLSMDIYDKSNDYGENVTSSSSPQLVLSPPRPPARVLQNESLLKEWKEQHQRVTNVDVDEETNMHTNAAWENELARHILSVYTSHQVKKGGDEKHNQNTSVMEYVDTTKEDNATTVKDFISSSKHVTYHHSHTSPHTSSQHTPSADDADKLRQYIAELAKSSKYRNTIIAHAPVAEVTDPTRVDFRYRSKALKRGAEIPLRSSPKVSCIWFTSSGDIDLDWCYLPGGKVLQAQLTTLYENRNYSEYLTAIENTIFELWGKAKGYVQDNSALKGRSLTLKAATPITSTSPKKVSNKMSTGAVWATAAASAGANDEDPYASQYVNNDTVWGTSNDINVNTITPIDSPIDNTVGYSSSSSIGNCGSNNPYTKEAITLLFLKLIAACNALIIINIEKRNFDLSMELLTRLEKWTGMVDMLPRGDDLKAIRAAMYDTFAYYFYRRKRNPAALNNATKSYELYDRLNSIQNVGVSLLHLSAIHCQSGRYKESYKLLHEFIALTEHGRLSLEQSSPKWLCTVAVAYHNQAVVELKLDFPDLAAKSSQNGRKLARLCLSYANRWLPVFEATHECACDEIKFQIASKHGLQHDHIKVSEPIIDMLYSDNNDEIL